MNHVQWQTNVERPASAVDVNALLAFAAPATLEIPWLTKLESKSISPSQSNCPLPQILMREMKITPQRMPLRLPLFQLRRALLTSRWLSSIPKTALDVRG